MADSPSVALLELVRKASVENDLDFLREGVRVLAEAVMEAEVGQHMGAGPYERTSERRGERRCRGLSPRSVELCHGSRKHK